MGGGTPVLRTESIKQTRRTVPRRQMRSLVAGSCFGVLASIVMPAVGMAESVIIQGATVFDATGQEPFVGDVRIDDEVISTIGTNLRAGSDVTVIDASGLSLLPGLIDIHVHWTAQSDGPERLETAHTLVSHGITTAADFHSAPESYAPKRLWEQAHNTPHTVYAARVSTPGGHGADWADINTTRTITSAYEARAAFGHLIGYKPDLIKVFSDGWRYGSGIDNSSINEDALTAIVEEARNANTPVLTHTVTVAKAKIAAKAKVTAIVHAIQDRDTDDELVSLLKESGVYYAPTLAVYEPREDKLADATEEDLLSIRKRQAHSRHNLRKFAEAGVKIALGTDSGIASTPYGESSLRELELLVEFGLSPKNALIAGTANSAAVLGLSRERGTIEVGRHADLVLVKGKPWRNISDYRNIEYVFIDGRLAARGGAAIPSVPDKAAQLTIAESVIDDFERLDGRTRTGALRLQDTDRGHPRSTVISQVVPRRADNHALHVSASMALKEGPHGLVYLPLSIGSFSAVDVAPYNGIRVDLRGDGRYFVGIRTVGGTQRKDVVANHEWRTLTVPFIEFSSSSVGDDVVDRDKGYGVEFGAFRPGGESFWLEIDNVEFY